MSRVCLDLLSGVCSSQLLTIIYSKTVPCLTSNLVEYVTQGCIMGGKENPPLLFQVTQTELMRLMPGKKYPSYSIVIFDTNMVSLPL